MIKVILLCLLILCFVWSIYKDNNRSKMGAILLFLFLVLPSNVFAYYDPNIGINNFYGVNFTIPNKSSYVHFNSHGQASSYVYLAEQYDYSGTSDKSLDLKYFYHYKAGWINDEYGIGIGFYPTIDIPKNANVSLSMAICEDGDPWFVYNLSQVMVGENELNLTFVDTDFSRNTLGTNYQGISNSFNYCRIYKANFVNPLDNAPYLGLRFKTTPGTFAGVGNMIAFIGYQLNVNGIDYTGDYFSLTNQLNDISNDLTSGLSSVERIAQDNSDTLNNIYTSITANEDPNYLGTQNLKFTDNNGFISSLPVYFPNRFGTNFYNITSNGFTQLGTSEQYDFNDNGGSVPEFSTKYFYTNTSGLQAYPNGIGLQWVSSKLIPAGYNVQMTTIVGTSSNNSNIFTSVPNVYSGGNVGFYDTDKVKDLHYNIEKLDSCPDTFTIVPNQCFKITTSFITKNVSQYLGLTLKSSSSINLGNWLTFYGYDLDIIGEDEETKFCLSASCDYIDFDTDDDDQYNGISSVITIPLTYLTNLSNQTCSSFTLPIPYIDYNLVVPCMSSVYNNISNFNSIKSLIQLVYIALIGYYCVVDLLYTIKGFKDPESDRIEVLDL